MHDTQVSPRPAVSKIRHRAASAVALLAAVASVATSNLESWVLEEETSVSFTLDTASAIATFQLDIAANSAAHGGELGDVMVYASFTETAGSDAAVKTTLVRQLDGEESSAAATLAPGATVQSYASLGWTDECADRASCERTVLVTFELIQGQAIEGEVTFRVTLSGPDPEDSDPDGAALQLEVTPLAAP